MENSNLRALVQEILESPKRSQEEAVIDDGTLWENGKYVIKTQLGGKMGSVFLAQDTSSKQDVALKIIKARGSNPKEEEIERFKREIMILSQLDHPGIIRFLYSGIHYHKGRDVLYYTMEFIPGSRPLSDFMRLSHSVLWSVFLILNIANAIEHAHTLDKGSVIHRDVKPDNILLTDMQKGTTKLLDFGLARKLVRTETFTLTQTRQILGTPQYMSPEQYQNPKNADHRTDIYSLGAVLYHLLTGHLPIQSLKDWKFCNISDLEVLKNAFDTMKIDFDFGNQVHLDTKIQAICQKALARDPQERYQKAENFVVDMEAYLKECSQNNDHFICLSPGNHVILKRQKTNLGIDLHGNASINPTNIYANLIKFSNQCEIFLEKPLKINGREHLKGHFRLSHGDRIEMDSFLVGYKKFC
ncbi:MAG: serine/threonine protein kinase [Candidatus Brocadiae bacterium]|nr:serine/threonine protein kinase [Candidatus Brocadiia bacterium]